MPKILAQRSFSALLTALIATLGMGQPILAQEVTLARREITTERGLLWAAEKWPYNTTVNIEEGGKLVGRAVLDRHGIDFYEKVDALGTLGGLIKNPFSGARPWRVVMVSTWSSQTDGCFMELLVQVGLPVESSFRDRQALIPYLVPARVQVQIGNQSPVELSRKRREAKFGGPYVYRFYNSTRKNWFVSAWHQARNAFILDSKQAKAMLDAPTGEAKLLVSFPNNIYKFYSYPIGKGTTQRWRDAYSFNPDCSANALPQSLPSSSQAFRPRGPFDFPSDQQFRYFDQTVEDLRRTEVKLTATDQKQRRAIQQSWAKRNELANYLGGWSSGDRAFYIFPAQRKKFACVVVQEGNETRFNVGYTFTGKELRYGDGRDKDNALYWRNKPDVIAARDSGPGELYPLFAAQRSLTVSERMQEDFKQAGCPTELKVATAVEPTVQPLKHPLSQLFAWLQWPLL